MSSFLDQWNLTFRPYVVDGLPVSGVYKPEKGSIKTVGATLDGLIAQALTGTPGGRPFDPPATTGAAAFPSTGGSGSGGAIKAGDRFEANKAGYIPKASGTQLVAGGDIVIAKVDTPGQTVANWTYQDRGLGSALALKADVTYVDTGLGAKVAQTLTIGVAGLATGGGDLTANRTITVPKASAGDVATGTDDAKAMTPLSAAAAFAGKLDKTTYSATITQQPGEGVAIADDDKNQIIRFTKISIIHPDMTTTRANAVKGALAGARQQPGDGIAFDDENKNRVFGVNKTDIFHPKIAAMSSSIDSLMSGGGGGSSGPVRDAQWDDIQMVAEIVALLMYGQSLSRGVYSQPPLSVTTYAYILMFAGGMRPDQAGGTTASQFGSFVQAYESAFSNYGETPVMGCLLMIAQLLRDENGLDLAAMGQYLLGSALGESGKSASDLSNGGSYFPRLVNAVTYGPANAATLGRTFAPGVVGFEHGQTDVHDVTSPSTYQTLVEAIRSDLESTVAGVQGFTRRLPMVMSQTASHIIYGKTPDIALRQLQMCTPNSLFGFIGPDYPYSRYIDGLHFDNMGSMQFGARMGLFIKRWLYDGHKIAPFTPTVERNGTSIIARFPVESSRKVKLKVWPSVVHYGATVVNASNVDIPVTAVVPVGVSAVKISTGSTIVATNKLRLGFIGDSTLGKTGVSDDEPLRFDPTGFNLSVERWAPICEIPVT